MPHRTTPRSTLALLALLSFLGSLLATQPHRAQAATQVTWNFQKPTVLKMNVPKQLSLTGVKSTTPAIAFKPVTNHPCAVTRTAANSYFAVGKYSNISYFYENCTVNATTPNGVSITPKTATYYVLSNGPVKMEAPMYCVSNCNYNDGINESITRWRESGICYKNGYAPDFSTDSARGSSTAISCPHTIAISGPAKKAANVVFDVTARSTLLVFVTLSTSTPTICTVTKTWQQRTHQVKGLKKGTCKLKATYPGSPELLSSGAPKVAAASSSTLSVSITKSSNTTPESEQTISVQAPASVMETSLFSITASSSSGLPVELIHDPASSCQPTSNPNELRADFFSPNATCVVTVVQPGGTVNGVEFKPAPDVVVTVPIECSPQISCPPPPVCNPDTASAAYAANQVFLDNVLDNDTGLGLTAAIASRPSSGTLTLEPNGAVSWTAPQYFVGPTSFSYTATDTKGQRCTGTVSFTVLQPEIPEAPLISPTITATANAWARLSVNERFSLSAALNCPISTTPSTVCGTTPETSTAIVGAYSEITAVTVSTLDLIAPAGYPSNRYTFTPPTLTNLTPPAFVSGVQGTMRFQQATSASAKFELKAAYTLVFKTVRWSRFNGVLQRIEGPSRTVMASTSTKFGVVGASN